MYPRILEQLREKVCSAEYVMTLHAEEEMEEDGLTILDVEHGILSGEIIERQLDRQTAERKYVVRGKTENADRIIVVALKLGMAGKLVIITVYVE